MTSTKPTIPRMGRMTTRCGKIDHIQELLRLEVERFRHQSFQNFALEIYVYPADAAHPVYDNRREWLGFDEYRFEAYGKDSKSMQVRIRSRSRVEIWFAQRWRPVAEYLVHVEPLVDWNAPVNGLGPDDTYMKRLGQQQRWWAANRKTFRLMELPSEIREIIYAFALGPRVEPYPTCKARRLGNNYAAVSAILARKPNSNLLYTSKLVYEEASSILFKHTTFFVDRLGVLEKLLKNHEQRGRIKRLQLALDHLDYVKLFGINASEEIRFEPRIATSILRDMSLNHLKIDFAAPSPLTSAHWLDNACQKLVVDWILQSAWPIIRGQPIELAGYVKNSSKALFESKKFEESERIEIWQKQRVAADLNRGELSEYYADLDEEEGGVLLEQSEEIHQKMGNPDTERKLPLVCQCHQPCDAKPWSCCG